MARSVPKCKRAAYVYDRDFIVVDDISGVLKMRSECAIDGYGFLSSQGDIRNPQEIPPIINEQMAAWPDPRPIGQPVFTPSPDYQYFFFNYVVTNIKNRRERFLDQKNIRDNVLRWAYDWYLSGVYLDSGGIVALQLNGGNNNMSVKLTDEYGNTSTFNFVYFVDLNTRLLESGGWNRLLEDGGLRLLED